ncbi:unnamed protein product [Alternaria burnsii]|nr:unnamed protein product [Alternaria burnsii]
MRTVKDYEASRGVAAVACVNDPKQDKCQFERQAQRTDGNKAPALRNALNIPLCCQKERMNDQWVLEGRRVHHLLKISAILPAGAVSS